MAFNQEIADKVCERLAAGESLRKASESEGTTPWSILRWIDANDSFSQQYAQARDIGYKLLADELLAIADDGSNDTYQTENGPATNQDVIARSRLRVDTRKWMLSKMLPKVYGDKLELGGTLAVKATPADMSDEQLLAIALGRNQNSLVLKVPENTGLDLPTIENYPNGDN